MWLIYFLFGFLWFVVWWLYSGYLIWLYLAGKPERYGTTEVDEANLPELSVVVCCLNERALIADKMRNLAAARYPRNKFHVFVIDGGSSDETQKLALAAACEAGLGKVVRVVESSEAGKVNQLNVALRLIPSGIVVVTDADAMINADVLWGIAQAFARDDRLGVVGAFSEPAACSEVEATFWDNQNRIRLLESSTFSSSIVVAPCYGFRRNLFEIFPEDTVADDIYVSFQATTSGYRTTYREELRVKELRAPKNTPEFCRHKFRKSHAYCIEVLRFLYRLPWMEGRFKIIFLTRALQVFGTPFLLAGLGLVGLSVLSVGGYWTIGTAGLAMALSLAATRHVLSRVPIKMRQQSIVTAAKAFALTNLVLLSVAIAYPFYRQSSQYGRLSGSFASINSGDQLGAKEQAENEATVMKV